MGVPMAARARDTLGMEGYTWDAHAYLWRPGLGIHLGCPGVPMACELGPVNLGYTPDPLKGFKWVKDRQGKKTSFWGQPKKLIAFDDIKKVHKARVRAAAMACPGCTWQQAATKGRISDRLVATS
jgi:hypothetical protein